MVCVVSYIVVYFIVPWSEVSTRLNSSQINHHCQKCRRNWVFLHPSSKAENLIRDALLANKYLSKVLSKDQVEDMVSVAYSMKVKKGEEVVKEGSLFADRFV